MHYPGGGPTLGMAINSQFSEAKMGDGGIVVITLTGGDDDSERLAVFAEEALDADVLKIRPRGSIPARTMRKVSEIAEANDLKMKFE